MERVSSLLCVKNTTTFRFEFRSVNFKKKIAHIIATFVEWMVLFAFGSMSTYFLYLLTVPL